MSVDLFIDYDERLPWANYANANFRRLIELANDFDACVNFDEENLCGTFTADEAQRLAGGLARALEELPAQLNTIEEVGGDGHATMIYPNDNVSNLVWWGGKESRILDAIAVLTYGEAVNYG